MENKLRLFEVNNSFAKLPVSSPVDSHSNSLKALKYFPNQTSRLKEVESLGIIALSLELSAVPWSQKLLSASVILN